MTITVLFGLWLVMVFLMLSYIWKFVGELILLAFPREHSQKGDKLAIYLNGRYNRTATITGIGLSNLYIYENKVKLPLNFRGKFYGVGYDPEDCSRLVYVPNVKHHWLVRIAEFVRKVFILPDDLKNLECEFTSKEYFDELFADGGQAEE